MPDAAANAHKRYPEVMDHDVTRVLEIWNRKSWQCCWSILKTQVGQCPYQGVGFVPVCLECLISLYACQSLDRHAKYNEAM